MASMIFENGVDGRRVMEVMGSKWNLMIIWSLREGAQRFTELQKHLGDVNSKTVTVHLRVLEKYQIINRVVYAEVPPRVEYSLTEHGKALLPVFNDILAWGASLHIPKEK
jgi:DNA-binding HxlR family transcriptional regulator